jgi:hypothetical protein
MKKLSRYYQDIIKILSRYYQDIIKILTTEHFRNIHPCAVLYFQFDGRRRTSRKTLLQRRQSARPVAVLIMSVSCHIGTAQPARYTTDRSRCNGDSFLSVLRQLPLPPGNRQLIFRATADTCTPAHLYTCHDCAFRYSALLLHFTYQLILQQNCCKKL